MKHLDVEDRARQSLRGIGFGEPVKIEALVGGRNDTFSVVLPNGETIFVKCLRGEESDMRARIARSLSFHQAWEVSSPVISTPALLGSSEEQGVLVHEWIDEAEGLGERSDENIFDETTAHACGVLLGELHAWQPPAGAVLDKALPPMPSAEHFNILPADAYTNASGAEL